MVNNNDSNYSAIPQQDYEDASPRPSSFLARLCLKLGPLRGYFFTFVATVAFPLSNIFVKKSSMLNGSDQLLVLFIVNFILMGLRMICIRANPFGPKGTRVVLAIRGFLGLIQMIFIYIGNF